MNSFFWVSTDIMKSEPDITEKQLLNQHIPLISMTNIKFNCCDNNIKNIFNHIKSARKRQEKTIPR